MGMILSGNESRSAMRFGVSAMAILTGLALTPAAIAQTTGAAPAVTQAPESAPVTAPSVDTAPAPSQATTSQDGSSVTPAAQPSTVAATNVAAPDYNPANDPTLKDACVQPPASYAKMADDFTADPRAYVDEASVQGGSVAIPVRNVLVVKPQEIGHAIDLLRENPSSDRARQIAIGIGQAATLCGRTNPAVALRFQQLISRIPDQAIVQAFNAATGDLATAALGRGGPGAGPGAPGISASPGVGTFTSGSGDDATPQQSGTSGRRSGGSVSLAPSNSNDGGTTEIISIGLTPPSGNPTPVVSPSVP